MPIKMIIDPKPEDTTSRLPDTIYISYPYGVLVKAYEGLDTLIDMIGWVEDRYPAKSKQVFRTFNHFRFRTEAEQFEFVMRWRGSSQ